MKEYPIYQCTFCRTGFVHPMPDKDSLCGLYDGFLGGLDSGQMSRFREIASQLYLQLGLQKGLTLNMLDIGGGGGYFCKAFEELGYGEATYVDLDPQSCTFAREKLGLNKVFECDAMILQDVIELKFDFIYCRHLIEHLPNPTLFLLKIMDVLKETGVLVVQFPNGDSLEYLAYPHTNIKDRFKKIRTSNNFSLLKTLWIMISGKVLHGMDPPRHLWAISRKGISQWAKKNHILCKKFTRHLGDVPFSPGYFKKSNLKGKLLDFFGQRFLSPIRGGTHLVVILRKQA